MAATPDNRITFLARLNFRDDRRLFGIRRADRRAHLYVIGKTGTGKSTFLETLVRQDIGAGEGLALLDPHGDLVERLLAAIPARRREDLIWFNVPDTARPLGFNPLERVPPERCALAASGLLEVFKKIWAESWGPRLEHILRMRNRRPSLRTSSMPASRAPGSSLTRAKLAGSPPAPGFRVARDGRVAFNRCCHQ